MSLIRYLGDADKKNSLLNKNYCNCSKNVVSQHKHDLGLAVLQYQYHNEFL
jgi:hypothetical protein